MEHEKCLERNFHLNAEIELVLFVSRSVAVGDFERPPLYTLAVCTCRNHEFFFHKIVITELKES